MEKLFIDNDSYPRLKNLIRNFGAQPEQVLWYIKNVINRKSTSSVQNQSDKDRAVLCFGDGHACLNSARLSALI